MQHPNDALYSSMPRGAIEHVAVDHVLPLAEIPPLLTRLAHEPAADEGAYPLPHGMELEANLMEMDKSTLHQEERVGTPSMFSCPECKGVLYKIEDGNLTRFRCRTGHGYSAEPVLVEQAEMLEQALYIALNTLEESAAMTRRLHKEAERRGQHWLVTRFASRSRQAEQRVEVIRQVLLREEHVDHTEDGDDQPAAGMGDNPSRFTNPAA